MKKIMFNDNYGLTKLVIAGIKTKTRRIYKCPSNSYGGIEIKNNRIITFNANGNEIETFPKYNIDEMVAVAQCYNDLKGYGCYFPKGNGQTNKMFVRADLMPKRIIIKDVRVEKLQDISDADCIDEGIMYEKNIGMYFLERKDGKRFYFKTPREAYADLIDRISGRGTWDKNPYVYVYEFIIIDNEIRYVANSLKPINI